MQVMELSFALTTLIMGQTLQVMADEARVPIEVRSAPVIPATKPNCLPKYIPIGDFRSLPARGFNGLPIFQDQTPIIRNGKVVHKKSNCSPAQLPTVPVGDFGTAHTYPATSKTKVQTGPLKKQ